MKVLWIGDAVVSTGFSRCTHAACDALHAAGHEVHVLGINYFGDPHAYPYAIYPCINVLDHGRDIFGMGRLPYMMERLKPDVVVLLNDPWNVPAYLDTIAATKFTDPATGKVPVVAWVAVDAKNHPASDRMNRAHVVSWTQFGIDELRRGGFSGEASIVPLGVDRSVFKPRDKREARKAVCVEGHREGFIVGVVGRNQPRKRVDLSIEYFAEWVHRYKIDDAYLYLHIAPTGETSCDIRAMVKYHGITNRVILAEPEQGFGIDEAAMPLVYSAFDVCLTTTQGEGWGLTTMEAMACGTPCIVPDWSALGEWCEKAAMKIPCTSTALSAPLNGAAYTVGGIMDAKAAVLGLNFMYRDAELRREYVRRGLELTARTEYQWGAVGQAFCEVVEAVALREPAEVAR